MSAALRSASVLRPSLGLALLGATLVASMGCEERTLTDRDCLMIQERIEGAWSRDAVAAQKLAETEDLGAFIGAEGDRLAQRWGKRCNALVGQPISEEELTCLRNAQTIDDFEECRR